MRDNKVVIEVYHRRKIYRVYVENTGQMLDKDYVIRHSNKAPAIDASKLEMSPCSRCTALMVNGICMNRKCELNEVS